jgi:murein DD-endopeptidase MepM/ murein hydrolase activator NlpD
LSLFFLAPLSYADPDPTDPASESSSEPTDPGSGTSEQPATPKPTKAPTNNGPEIKGQPNVEMGSLSLSEMRTKLDALEAEQRELAAQMAASGEKLNAAMSQLNDTRTQIASQKEQMAHLESQLAQIALQQYQDRGMNSTAVIMTSDSSQEFLDYLSMMLQVTQTANTLFTALQIEQTTLAELERGEKAAVEVIQREQEEIAALEDASRLKVAQTANLLGNMSGMSGGRVSNGSNAIGRGVANPWETVPNPSASLRAPMNKYTITSPYGMRIHPISGAWAFHDGIDLGGSCGSPIVSPANGYVIDYYWGGGYGNRIVIDHGIIGGRHVVTSHNHLSSGVAKPGTSVVQGQVIATVGSTGYSTGCHDHYMIWMNGEIIDPGPYV